MRLINFVLTLLLSTQAHAISCDLAALMSHPSVATNADFWQEMGNLGDGVSDADLRNLFRKYGVDSPLVERRVVERATTPPASSSAAQAASGEPQFTLSKQAIKDSRNLKPSLKKDLDQFLTHAKGGVGSLQAELRKNAGKWNYKKLAGGFHDTYSARLDGAYRVVFKQTEEGRIEILAIDKTTTH